MIKRGLARVLAAVLLLTLTGCGAGVEEGGKIPKPADDAYRNYYEVFVRSYYDGNGDGIGDLEGLTQKLDYIEDLGFNGIWLMPVMPSPTYHKYDVTDYFGIDPEYGTLEDFKDFIKACGERDIHVILDLVINHTSSQHPWFTEACRYLQGLAQGQEPDRQECPYVDYYHFTREKQAGYAQVSGTDWYYECVFWEGMPDLNLQSQAVREEIERITDYWLDLGVSGFRLDAVKEYESGSTSRSVEILTWYVDYVRSRDPQAYLVAEVWDSLDVIAAYYASGISSIFDYPFGNSDGQIVKALRGAGDGKSGAAFARAVESVENRYREQNPGFIDAPFFSNHDTGRIAGFLGPSVEKIKLGGAMNLLMSGSVFVYYGEEIGMKGAGKDENKRAPMYFTSEESPGTPKAPPGMDAVEQKYGSLEEQEGQPGSIYCYYRKAMYLRNTYPEIARGRQRAVELSDGDIIVIAKEYQDAVTYVVINNSPDGKELDLSGTELSGRRLADSLLVTYGEEGLQPSVSGDELTVPGFGVCILK